MNTKAKRRHEDLEYIRSWFNYPGQPHVATLRDGWIVFARPSSSTYRVDYHVNLNRLIVCGDIGDAVFTWSQIVTFDWIAGLNFDYFYGKCVASEMGMEYYQWDAEAILESLESHLVDEGDKSLLDRAIEEGAHDAVHNEQEWYQWVGEHGYELLGDDFSEWVGNGRVPNIRARGMFEGLKLAVAQLAVPA